MKTKNKVIVYIGIGVTLVLVLFSSYSKPSVGNVGSTESSTMEEINPELERYRSESIPEECRMPSYENNLESWKQHLSHHEPTWFCLEEYYGESIENYINR